MHYLRANNIVQNNAKPFKEEWLYCWTLEYIVELNYTRPYKGTAWSPKFIGDDSSAPPIVPIIAKASMMMSIVACVKYFVGASQLYKWLSNKKNQA